MFFRDSRDQSDFYASADAEVESSPGVQQDGGTVLAEVAGEGPLASCPHVDGGPEGLLKQEAATWRDAIKSDAEGGGSAHMCNGRKDHGIPLPATELGDAALVTAKTVQCTE